MATKTHRGITYTTSSSAAIDVLLDMPLQGGVDQDETTWLGSSYPGALTSFEPRQTDGSNIYNPRLLVVHVSTMANDETLTLSGECSEIMHASCQWAETNAAPGLSQHVASGVLANGAVTTSATTITADGATLATHFSAGDFILNSEGAIVGTIASQTTTVFTLEAAATVALANDAALHKRTPLVLKNTSGTTESVTLMLLVR